MQTGKQATASARRQLDDLRETAETLDAAPLQIEAALASGSPALVIEDIDALVARMRTEKMTSIFRDEEELRRFYRIMAERNLSWMAVLTEKALQRVALALEDPKQTHSLRNLSMILDALTKQESHLGQAIRQSQTPDANTTPRSDAELRAQVIEIERTLRDGAGGGVADGGQQ